MLSSLHQAWSLGMESLIRPNFEYCVLGIIRTTPMYPSIDF